MSSNLRLIKIVLLMTILLTTGFFFSCTLPLPRREEKKPVEGTGLIIKDVKYEEEVPEGQNVKINVSLRNEGFDAEDVVVILSGLSDRWSPPPDITNMKSIIQEGKEESFIFELKAPNVETNTSYSFSLAVEYDYTSKYILFLKLERKDDNNITIRIEEEKMLGQAPIQIKLASRLDRTIKETVPINFTIKNVDKGKVLNNEIVRISASKLVCKNEEIKLKRGGEILECSLKIPDFVRSLTLEIQLEARYRYFYQLEKPYKIKVYDVK